jgi:hypothetical protein
VGYDLAIDRAWDALVGLKATGKISVRFLADEYSIDLEGKKVLSLSCNIAAKDFTAVLILHYLIQKLKGLPALTGEWLTFRELSGIEGYYPAFRKRAIEPIIRKYGNNPEGLSSTAAGLAARKINEADAAVILDALSGVPVLIKLWKADAEFAADANIYFDRSVTGIFCTEDIVVLAGIIASQL